MKTSEKQSEDKVIFSKFTYNKDVVTAMKKDQKQ